MTSVSPSSRHDYDTSLRDAVRLLRDCRRLVVLTGAGVSRESGIPTFREAQTGLWARYDPAQLATPQAFARDPKLVWAFYQARREKLHSAQPNPAHHALAALEARWPHLTLITQNVDRLHESAGSTRVIRLHGTLDADRCSADCQGSPTPVDRHALPAPADGSPPACPHCGAPIRPDVVWFGEALPQAALRAASEACASADVMLVVGTSGLVTPAAGLPAQAHGAGARIIEINPERSDITPLAVVWVVAAAGHALPALVRLLEAAEPSA